MPQFYYIITTATTFVYWYCCFNDVIYWMTIFHLMVPTGRKACIDFEGGYYDLFEKAFRKFVWTEWWNRSNCPSFCCPILDELKSWTAVFDLFSFILAALYCRYNSTNIAYYVGVEWKINRWQLNWRVIFWRKPPLQNKVLSWQLP
jgi:hypothetical protein